MVNRFESIACEAHVFGERERKDVYHNIITSIWRSEFLQAISKAG
jgi:hypothetical protein